MSAMDAAITARSAEVKSASMVYGIRPPEYSLEKDVKLFWINGNDCLTSQGHDHTYLSTHFWSHVALAFLGPAGRALSLGPLSDTLRGFSGLDIFPRRISANPQEPTVWSNCLLLRVWSHCLRVWGRTQGYCLTPSERPGHHREQRRLIGPWESTLSGRGAETADEYPLKLDGDKGYLYYEVWLSYPICLN